MLRMVRAKPVIAVHTEYDALPGVLQEAGDTEKKPAVTGAPGHAEGHNCGSALALGALFAVKQAMDENKLPGTVKFFGVPAEELVLSPGPRCWRAPSLTCWRAPNWSRG